MANAKPVHAPEAKPAPAAKPTAKTADAPMTQAEFEAALAAMQEKVDAAEAAVEESNNNAGHRSVVKNKTTLADGTVKTDY